MLPFESYTDDMLRKRLQKEWKLLDKLKRGITKLNKDTNFGMIIFLEYKKKFFKGIHCDTIKLEVHLEGKYPFQAPKVILASTTAFPSLCDGRNLLMDILKKAWTEDTTILDIANLFPAFLSEHHSNPSVGRFHLGHCMNLKHWDARDSMKLFYCQEVDPQNPKFSRDRALVLSHSMILQLETNPQYPGLGHLVCYASLFSLQTIKISKSDKEKITFEWKIPDSSNALAQQFKIKNLQEFIELLLKNTSRLEIGIDRKILRPNASISEDEVSAQALTKIQINEIMSGIIQHEVEIQDEMSKDKINELIELYQQAIEYYSAIGDTRYDTYLQKVRKLLADEVVLDVLAGKPPPRKAEIKPAMNKTVREIEDLEIWPQGPPGVSEAQIIVSEVQGRKKEENEEEEEREEELEQTAGNLVEKIIGEEVEGCKEVVGIVGKDIEKIGEEIEESLNEEAEKTAERILEEHVEQLKVEAGEEVKGGEETKEVEGNNHEIAEKEIKNKEGEEI